ncbi:hypothetical protein HDU76_005243, partial [Blyttiomyces sp. JEL0837]
YWQDDALYRDSDGQMLAFRHRSLASAKKMEVFFGGLGMLDLVVASYFAMKILKKEMKNRNEY